MSIDIEVEMIKELLNGVPDEFVVLRQDSETLFIKSCKNRHYGVLIKIKSECKWLIYDTLTRVGITEFIHVAKFSGLMKLKQSLWSSLMRIR